MCALSLGTAVALPAPASAKHATTSMRLSVSRSGHRLTIRILSARPGAKCVIRVSAKKRHAAFAVWKVGKRGIARVSWTAPGNAPGGVWSFVATCARGKERSNARAKMRWVHRGSGNGSLASSQTGGGKGGGNQSCAPVTKGGPPSTYCFMNDPFATYEVTASNPGGDTGQCTWFAAGMRPDLDGVERYDASTWLTYAQRAGIPTGNSPVQGSIAVSTTADHGVGHVAYVAGTTNGGATLILDEANADNHGNVWLNVAESASDYQGYIYGGPAGKGPGGGGVIGPGGGAAAGHLAVWGAQGSSTLSAQLAPGTSPSAVAVAGGSYEVAYQDSTGHLAVWGAQGSSTLSAQLAPGTSPSAVAVAGGSYEVAYQTSG